MPKGYKQNKNILMLKNYFKTAWRNLMKYKLYSFLNIAGLTVGILCSCLIFLYVTDELSYDNYSPLASRTYRINFFAKLGDQNATTAQTPALAGPVFKTELPQIEEAGRAAALAVMAYRDARLSFGSD